MTLISENNRQYYIGAQSFIASGGLPESFTTTFNTDLVFATADPTNVNWPANNFYLEVSVDGGFTYTPLYNTYTVVDNTITVTGGLAAGNYLRVQLTENTVWQNYGGYTVGSSVYKTANCLQTFSSILLERSGGPQASLLSPGRCLLSSCSRSCS